LKNRPAVSYAVLLPLLPVPPRRLLHRLRHRSHPTMEVQTSRMGFYKQK